jgi:hypothetical protein
LPLLPLPVTAATVVVTLVAGLVPVLAAVLALPFVVLLLLVWPALATTELVAEPDELQIVSLLAAFRDPPRPDDASRARPWVTRWKFSRTSPIEDEMRVTPGFAEWMPACWDG